MHHSRPKDKAQRFEGSIRYEGRDLFVKAVILPAKHAPHVGADSPRFMEPGSPAQVVYYSLHDDDNRDITTDYCMDADDRAITALILDAWVLDHVAERIMEKEGVVA